MTKSKHASFRQLHYFVALAEELNFGRAATRLGIAQPSLTRQVQTLEKVVGTALVERTQREVILTAAGQAFLQSAQVTLQHHERSLQTARNVAARSNESLAIGFESCARYHNFPEVVKQFLARHPRTRLSSYQMSCSEQAVALTTHQIDVGFMHPPIPAGTSLAFEPMGEDRFVVALPSTHRLASRKRIASSELAQEKFSLYPRKLAPGCYDAVLEICRCGFHSASCTRIR